MRKYRIVFSTAAAALSAHAWAAEPASVGARFEAESRTPGLKMLGWEVRPSLELRGGYDDNANRSVTAAQESLLLGLRGAIDARRQLGAAELAFDAGVGQEWYAESPENDVLTANARLRGAVYAGNQLTLNAAAGVERGAEGITSGENGVIVAGVLDPYIGRPEFTRVPLSVGAAQDFGRFFWDANITATNLNYDRQTTLGGLAVEQGFRNGWEGEAAARVGYRLSEGFGFFVRGQANQRRYDDSAADNDGWAATGGVEFELSRLLIGEVTAGWAEQTFEVTGQSNAALTYGAGLTWFASPLLSLTLDASRGFRSEQSIDALGIATTTPVLTDNVSLRAELEVLRSLLVFTEAAYSQNESDDGVQDNSLSQLSLGAAYILSRNLQLNAQYGYTLAQTNNSGDIIRNAVSLGLIAAY
jgi:hypothetical protein